MRTTIDLDDEALASAMKAASGKTETDVINEALREFARRRGLQDFLEFKGKIAWEGDLDDLRGRKQSLTDARSETLDALRTKFEGLLERMQTPAAKKGMETAFNATPAALGRAAVMAARRRR